MPSYSCSQRIPWAPAKGATNKASDPRSCFKVVLPPALSLGPFQFARRVYRRQTGRFADIILKGLFLFERLSLSLHRPFHPRASFGHIWGFRQIRRRSRLAQVVVRASKRILNEYGSGQKERVGKGAVGRMAHRKPLVSISLIPAIIVTAIEAVMKDSQGRALSVR